jgi:hypothetical protein
VERSAAHRGDRLGVEVADHAGADDSEFHGWFALDVQKSGTTLIA